MTSMNGVLLSIAAFNWFRSFSISVLAAFNVDGAVDLIIVKYFFGLASKRLSSLVFSHILYSIITAATHSHV